MELLSDDCFSVTTIYIYTVHICTCLCVYNKYILMHIIIGQKSLIYCYNIILIKQINILLIKINIFLCPITMFCAYDLELPFKTNEHL